MEIRLSSRNEINSSNISKNAITETNRSKISTFSKRIERNDSNSSEDDNIV